MGVSTLRRVGAATVLGENDEYEEGNSTTNQG